MHIVVKEDKSTLSSILSEPSMYATSFFKPRVISTYLDDSLDRNKVDWGYAFA